MKDKAIVNKGIKQKKKNECQEKQIATTKIFKWKRKENTLEPQILLLGASEHLRL